MNEKTFNTTTVRVDKKLHQKIKIQLLKRGRTIDAFVDAALRLALKQLATEKGGVQ